MPKVVLAVGLTGGHIYPALALAQDLGADYQCLFVVRKNSPVANRILASRGYPLLELEVTGLPRGVEIFWLGFGFFFKQIRAFLFVRRALRDWRPDLAVGFGSYVSFPALLAARLQGVPILLFEPNRMMGIANKALQPIADKIALAMDSGSRDGGKYVGVSPPLRKELMASALPAAGEARRALGLDPGLRCLLVFGGSQGARGMNQAVAEVFAGLKQEGMAFSFIHIAGEAAYHEMRSYYESKSLLGPAGACLGFFEEMEKAYQAADLVISRAGAMTCLELLYFKKRAILIPFGHAAEGHQLENARYLEQFGIARILQEGEGLKEALLAALRHELKSPVAPAGKVVALQKQSLADIAKSLIRR